MSNPTIITAAITPLMTGQLSAAGAGAGGVGIIFGYGNKLGARND